jgi:hypothetical protein
LTSKFAKSAGTIKKTFILQKCNMGIKNSEFFADFYSVEKVEKNSCEKVTKN